jgi:hypothetical protein
LGTNDFPELLNLTFDAESFRNTPQFLFMGALDENDAIPYADAFDQGERDLIYQLLGREMQPARWSACKNLYLLENINATIKTYGDLGHEQPGHVKEDIVTFFRSALNRQ